MPNVNDLKTSNFLAKEDVDPPILVTIDRYELQNVAKENQKPDNKWTVFFREVDKPLVLNMTNGQLIAQIIGDQDLDKGIGKKIVLYHDKTVMYAGKITGGIRVRSMKGQKPPPIEDKTDYGNPEMNGPDMSDIPF